MMLTSKMKQLQMENEVLKQSFKVKKMGYFAIGMGVGAFLTVTGSMLLKTEPIDKVKYQIYKIKEKLTKTANKTAENIDDAVEIMEKHLSEVTSED